MLLYVLEHGSSGLLAFSKICHGLFHKILTVNVKKYDPDVANSILNPLYRSSRSEVFLVKGALKTCSKFTGEHPCRSVISIKLQGKFHKNLRFSFAVSKEKLGFKYLMNYYLNKQEKFITNFSYFIFYVSGHSL